MPTRKTYDQKRSFDATPEPPARVEGDVDPGSAPPGETFMIHQHHATRLHFDLRLEMLNGDEPVLVSFAVPKNLPLVKGKPHLAIHVEDHPFDYGSFSGTIPAGNYGAGEVRIFDSGTYELLEQEPGKLTFRLQGGRLQGVWHMNRTRGDADKDEWLVFLKADERPEREPPPPPAPMLATLEREAFDDERYLFEPKWDGVRTLAICDTQARLLSRNLRDITATYPELAGLHDRLVCIEAIVDGEVVSMQGGRPSFERLQSRINLQNPRDIERAAKNAPVTFIAFDLLYLDGRSLVAEPIEERKRLLDELVVPSERLQVSTWLIGEGLALAEAARERNLEGIMAKKLGSPYRANKRTRDWLKIKIVFDADVVIGGWTPGEGARAGAFGALLVGAYDTAGELNFLGAVGTGFTDERLRAIAGALSELDIDECPFAIDPGSMKGTGFGKPIRGARWVEPALVCRVEYRELTSAHRFRAPSFKGLRSDKDPEECLLADIVEGHA